VGKDANRGEFVVKVPAMDEPRLGGALLPLVEADIAGEGRRPALGWVGLEDGIQRMPKILLYTYVGVPGLSQASIYAVRSVQRAVYIAKSPSCIFF
jgi:hypothetical protein